MNRKLVLWLVEGLALVVIAVVFLGPLLFAGFAAGKTVTEAAGLSFLPPATPQYWENFQTVVLANNFMLVRAFWNSTLLTVFSILVLVGVSSMAGYLLDRRTHRAVSIANVLILIGLMLPPSVITTIWVLKSIALYKSLVGLVLVEVALGFPYTVILYRAFSATIPRELDEVNRPGFPGDIIV